MSPVVTRHRFTRLIAGALVLCAFALSGAGSAAASPRLVAPAAGAVLPLGLPPTFVLKGRSSEIPTLEVSATPRTDGHGVFTDPAWSSAFESRPDGGAIRVTGRRSSYPARFWNRAGTYYWHAYIADCPSTGPRPHTCTERAITPTRSFTISAGGRKRFSFPLRTFAEVFSTPSGLS